VGSWSLNTRKYDNTVCLRVCFSLLCYEIPQLGPNLSRLNPAHSLTPCFFFTILLFSVHSYPQYGLFFQFFLWKFGQRFSSPRVRCIIIIIIVIIINIIINCKWVDTWCSGHFTYYILHMHGLQRLITLDLVSGGLPGKHVVATWKRK
jgi:hypothetical protein